MGDNQNLFVGIFADERAVQFKRLMEAQADRIFRELDNAVRNYRDGDERLDAPETYLDREYVGKFRVGLASISRWNPSILERQVRHLAGECNFVSTLYKYVVITYLKTLYKDQPKKKVNVHIPHIKDFLHTFFMSLASENVVQNGQYFLIGVSDKDLLIMNAVREALYRTLSPYVDFGTVTPAIAEPMTPMSSLPPTPQIPTPASIPPTPAENQQKRRSAFRASMDSALARMKNKSAGPPAPSPAGSKYTPSTPTPGAAKARSAHTRAPTLRELQQQAHSVVSGSGSAAKTPNITIDVETLGKAPREDRKENHDKASEKPPRPPSSHASKPSLTPRSKPPRAPSSHASKPLSKRSKKKASPRFFDSDEDEPSVVNGGR